MLEPVKWKHDLPRLHVFVPFGSQSVASAPLQLVMQLVSTEDEPIV